MLQNQEAFFLFKDFLGGGEAKIFPAVTICPLECIWYRSSANSHGVGLSCLIKLFILLPVISSHGGGKIVTITMLGGCIVY